MSLYRLDTVVEWKDGIFLIVVVVLIIAGAKVTGGVV